MKKSLLISVLAVIAVCMPLTGNAFTFRYDLVQPNTSFSDAKSEISDLGALGFYDVWYSADTNLLPTSASATITGLISGKIWSFEYSEDGSSWSQLGDLVSSFSTPARKTMGLSEDSTALIKARYIKLSYSWRLDSNAKASTHGAAQFDAVPIVPEPSSIIALGAMLSGMGMILHRRKG